VYKTVDYIADYIAGYVDNIANFESMQMQGKKKTSLFEC
jgi:hypothetical protein